MTRYFGWRGVIMVLLAVIAARHASGQDVVQGELGKSLDLLVRKDGPRGAVAVGVLCKGEVVLAKGYGTSGGRAVSADSLFEIASITKSFTAMAIFRLAAEGVLSIDDPVSKYIDGVREENRGITLHHLMTHTSGLTQEGMVFPQIDDGMAVARGVLAEAPKHKPGEKFIYHNYGSTTLAAIIEKATGKSFEEILIDRVLRPAGMERSTLINAGVSADEHAVARRGPSGESLGTAMTKPYPFVWAYKGCGGVVSSAREMLVWHAALRSDRLLTAEQRKVFLTPARSNYACGLRVHETSRGLRAEHSGGVAGFGCQFISFPDDDSAVVVLTDGRAQPVALAATLAAALEPLACAPIPAKIFPKGRELNEHKQFEAKDSAKWRVRRLDDGSGAQVELYDAAHDDALMLSMTLTRARLCRLADDLGGVLVDSVAAPGAGAARGLISISPYPSEGADEVSLPDSIEIQTQSGFYSTAADGTPVADQRPTLILNDSERRFWPVIVVMDASIAATLRADCLTAAK